MAEETQAAEMLPEEQGKETEEAPQKEVKPTIQIKHPAFVRWAVILAIAIVLNLFLVYATQVVYPAPLYEQFCKEEQTKQAYSTEEACVANGGQWNGTKAIADGSAPVPAAPEMSTGYCYADFTCNKDFQAENSVHQRNVFLVFVVIGLLLILGSSFLAGAEVLSAGLSFGGVLALIVGSLAYWSNMDDLLRVGVLGVALAALIFLAWKRFRD